MPKNVYSTCSPVAIGCFLYTNSGLTIPAVDGKYSDGSVVYTVSGGQITASEPCGETYQYYYADKYDCATCTLQETNVIVQFPVGFAVDITAFYKPLTPDGYVYDIDVSTSSGPGIDMDTTFSAETCALTCAGPTTTLGYKTATVYLGYADGSTCNPGANSIILYFAADKEFTIDTELFTDTALTNCWENPDVYNVIRNGIDEFYTVNNINGNCTKIGAANAIQCG